MQLDCRALLKRHKYLDSHRIGVWGWGYGGYASALLVSSQFQTFKCGIAVAPIADWRFYSKRTLILLYTCYARTRTCSVFLSYMATPRHVAT